MPGCDEITEDTSALAASKLDVKACFIPACRVKTGVIALEVHRLCLTKSKCLKIDIGDLPSAAGSIAVAMYIKFCYYEAGNRHSLPALRKLPA